MTLGAGTLWFAASGDYWSLLNPKFRIVTSLTGGSLAFLGLLHSLQGHSHRKIWASFLMALVAFGLWSWNLQVMWQANKKGGPESASLGSPAGEEGSRISLGNRDYIKVNIGELYLMHDGTEKGPDPRQWIFLGVVRTNEALAAKNMFLVSRPVMNCCLADAIEIGFLVTNPEGETPQNGSWVQVFGTVAELLPEERQEKPPKVPSTFPLVVQPRFMILADSIRTTPKPDVNFLFQFAAEEPFHY